MKTKKKWTLVTGKSDKSPLRQKDIRTGAQQERERIIRVLENLVIDSEGYFNVDKAIELIKGENE